MWFLFTICTILAWSGSDLFSKMGSRPDDKNSHWKMLMAVGFVMGLHAIYQVTVGGVHYELYNFIAYMPVSAMYIISMLFGYMGLRYIELSISSPICNSSGALVAVMCFIFLGDTMPPLALAAVALISTGIILLAVFEKRDGDKERAARGIKTDIKYERGLFAILFPVLYLVIDAMGTFLDGMYFDFALPSWFYVGVNEGNVETICNISYEFTFMIVGILAAVYVLGIKKEKLTLERDKQKLMAACFETVGQFTYVFALSGNAIIAAPAIGSYTIFSVLWSHLFLKEKLAKKQYLVIGMVLLGVVMLAFLDI
ncbi:MAG: EamA family transporter [Oscillospiraceae bacterium]